MNENVWLGDEEESGMIPRFLAWAAEELNRFGGKNKCSLDVLSWRCLLATEYSPTWLEVLVRLIEKVGLNGNHEKPRTCFCFN